MKLFQNFLELKLQTNLLYLPDEKNEIKTGDALGRKAFSLTSKENIKKFYKKKSILMKLGDVAGRDKVKDFNKSSVSKGNLLIVVERSGKGEDNIFMDQLKTLIENNTTNRFHINLSSHRFGYESIKKLSEILKISKSNIDVLDLSYNNIGDRESKLLVDNINSNKSIMIKNIMLSDNNISNKGVNQWAKLLGKNNKSIEYISFNRNKVDDSGLKNIFDNIKEDETIKGVYFKSNNIKSGGADIIIDALKVNKSLEEVGISQNKIGRKKTFKIEELLMKKN